MTVAASVRRAGNHPALEWAIRAGFVGYGLTHLAIAWLALTIAFGRAAGSGDQSGAFELLRRQPGGPVILAVVVVGLAAMALWQLLVAAAVHRAEPGSDRPAQRLVSVGRVVVYGFLAWTAGRVAWGTPTSSDAQQRGATAGILGHAAGQWLVALGGLAVLGLGIGLIVYGLKRAFRNTLGGMARRTRDTMYALGTTGYVAKGVAFGIVGVLLVVAARNDRAQSSGLDAALRTLTRQPFGGLLLTLVAIGLAAFGVYCFGQAKFRKV
jgi:hypothetical protein